MTSSDPASARPQPSITAVTRYDIFNYLREISSPWWGKPDEVTFLEGLYDLDQPTADNSRLPTVRADIQQHRIDNYGLDDDWIFEDSRLELSDGPDEVLLAFAARTVHPEVVAGVEEATKQVEELNRLPAPDGWGLRPHGFLSGRPIYTPVRLPTTGPLVPLPLNDDDTSKLDLVLGQTYSLLDCAGEEPARDLLRTAVLTLRRDGGFFHPMPGDGWTADTYEAVLTVERELHPTCTPEVKEVIWRTLESLLVVSIAERDYAASSGRLPMTWWQTPAWTATMLRLCATTSCNSRAMHMRSSTRRSCAPSSACSTRPRV